MKRNRRRSAWLIALAVLMTLLAVLLVEMAALAHREMLHEGFTQSQWYEGAIRSARHWRRSAVLAVLAASALWLAVPLRMRRIAKRRARFCKLPCAGERKNG